MKRKFVIFIPFFFLITTILFGFSLFSIYKSVNRICEKAKTEFGGTCQESLVKTLESETHSFKEKNDAIWALGQMADKESLETLKKYQNGDVPLKEPLDQAISQYELQKAINWCENNNLTSWMYERIDSQQVLQKNSVPLPRQEDTIQTFFNLMAEGRISDAVNMLTPDQIEDETSKQAWGAYFNAFQKIKVINIDNQIENIFKVTMDVEMKPESANATIPYYGYSNGENTRFITLEKFDNLWKIKGIATGP